MKTERCPRDSAGERGRLRPHCVAFGAVVLELLRDGRVLATMPPASLPFGCALQATVSYPSLAAFLAAMRAKGGT